jgi:predicted Zn-dependent peptidase
MSRFQLVRDQVLGEDVLAATTARGLRLRVLRRPAFREIAAVITFGYGSTDLRFRDADGEVDSPPGTAHYLEHKLFEDEDLHTFQRFGARGARVNASTGFSRTTYHFTATSHLADNLRDLLALVSDAHITDANVEKERGIIAQEVRMYEDSPDHGTMFDLLGCLYASHPVRHTVGGTVASIQQITSAGLRRCFHAFYRTGNAGLAVAGPVDPELVLDLAEACALAEGPRPASQVAADLGPVAASRRQRPMQVSRPKVLLGCKDRSLCASVTAQLDRQLQTRVLLDRLFAGSSEVRQAMRNRGDVDDSLGAGYQNDRSFGFMTVGCDTEDPARAEAAIRRALFAPAPLDDDHLDRIRRRVLGGHVRSCESVRALAFTHAYEVLDDIAPFTAIERVQALRLQDVEARQADLLREDSVAVAVTESRATA